MSSGATLMLRGSYQPLPRIQIEFDGPAPFARYELTDARGVRRLGRRRGRRSIAGLGSRQPRVRRRRDRTHHAATTATAAAIRGRRRRAGVGPFGVELGVKFAWNTLSDRSITSS